MNDPFAKPAKLEFIGNVAENFRRFKPQFEIYISAAGYDSRAAKVAMKPMHNIKKETNVVHKLSSTNMNEEQKNRERVKNRGQQRNSREQNTKPDCRYSGSQHIFRKQSAITKKMAACRSEKHYFPNLVSCKNIRKIFNTPYKFNQICLHSPENFC